PEHLVVSQRPGREANLSGDWVASPSNNAIEALVDLNFGVRMISVRRLRPDDMNQAKTFRSHRFGHEVGGLFLFINFTAVSNDRAIEQVSRVICRIVKMPKFLLVPTGLGSFVLEDSQELSRFGKPRSGRGRRPQSSMMNGEMPAGSASE